ncbi:hypothetical protein [Petroclostridium sp. X23]|uniref:hypothetical protein n=1 Tax=Petroclostridium sp. X23 TaxID=3045146 RepID=UPI0024AC833C|nr:hypothetical protein [Petroclostridium sp. X23]WHH57028.1 hypothetical protein QKW49_14375 [Petroclostridium sp. X23]
MKRICIRTILIVFVLSIFTTTCYAYISMEYLGSINTTSKTEASWKSETSTTTSAPLLHTRYVRAAAIIFKNGIVEHTADETTKYNKTVKLSGTVYTKASSRILWEITSVHEVWINDALGKCVEKIYREDADSCIGPA